MKYRIEVKRSYGWVDWFADRGAHTPEITQLEVAQQITAFLGKHFSQYPVRIVPISASNTAVGQAA